MRLSRTLAILLVATTVLSAQDISEQRLKWWREARFGMFIHWGVYSVPAGEWKGRPIPGIGEWIMNRAKIPVAEYEKLADQFNPVKFNADDFVAVAKNAGMKYIVITSKHHDGFAMFGSKVSRYNIVDATPFHRDVIKELSVACQRAGIRLCFYYSQTQDWHEFDAVGNSWDWPDDSKKDFPKYLEAKAKPQVREILSNYGPIGLIWFDTPRNMTKQQSQELADLVHQLQPMCLVNGRVGNGVGDYDSAGDNQISVAQVRRDWETPVTLNDTWGFKKDDSNWKSPAVLVRQLAQVAARGGNYLLNVGPTSEGLIPQPSVDRLAEVGRWMKVNGDSIYGATANPFPYDLPWGVLTSKQADKLYLHVFDWPKKEFVLYGLKTPVRDAYLLADAKHKAIPVKQESKPEIEHYALRLRLPDAAPDPLDSVIVLELGGKAEAVQSLLQQPDNTVTLPTAHAEAHHAESDPKFRLDGRGVAAGWINKDEWVSWDFRVSSPGEFDLAVITSEQKDGTNWEGGHRVALNVAGQDLKGAVSNDGKLINPSNPYWPYVISKMGKVKLTKAGAYHLTLKPESIEAQKKLGFTLVSVTLTPAK